MNAVVITGLLIAAVIHLLPLAGLAGMSAVQRLYDVRIDDASLGLLMVHRAVLFGLLGSFLILAAFDHDLRWPAIVGGQISAVSFVVIAYGVGGFNTAIKRVVAVDVVAIAALTLAAVAQSRL